MAALETSVLLLSIALLVPSLVLFLECVLALADLPPDDLAARRPSAAVLVPAHDEETVIERTIRSVTSQLGPADRLVVIADNCSDATASVAGAAGAQVVDRNDPERRGKGYALEHGVRHLDMDPPEVVVVVDADCTMEPGALERLVRAVAQSDRPVQGENRVVTAAGPDPLEALSAFAFLVKNVVRARGLSVARLPCQLSGTGMAFPWSVLRGAPLASGAIAEDLQLGADLALAGHPPRYCPSAAVTSPTPSTRHAVEAQRRRWEHGHLATALSRGPRLLAAGIAARRLDLLALALDLSVPPVSLLALAWLASAIGLGAGLATRMGEDPLSLTFRAALAIQAFSGGLILTAVVLSWLHFGRQELPARTLLLVPIYVLKKVPLYLAFLAHRERHWLRTARHPSARDR